MKPSTEWWRYLAPLAVIAIIALIPVPAGLESHTWLYFAVFTGVIVGLILEPVPGAVVAMVGISIIAILSPWLLFSPEQFAQHWLVHHVDGDCCRLRDQRHFPDGDGT